MTARYELDDAPLEDVHAHAHVVGEDGLLLEGDDLLAVG